MSANASRPRKRKLAEKLAEWGMTKKINQSEMKILIAKCDARMAVGRDTVFFKDGQPLEDVRLDRFRNRGFVKESTKASPSARMLSPVQLRN